MSEVSMKKVSANFQINKDSALYKNLIEPKSSARCFSEFVHDLLDIYNSDSDVRNLIDEKIEERNPLNQLKAQVMRVNSEHQKTLMSANILHGLIDFDSVDIFKPKGATNSSDVTANDTMSVFEKDGVIDNLRRLLPPTVQDEIRLNIDKRVETLEKKVEELISLSSANKGLCTSRVSNSPEVKVKTLVNNLETLYSVDNSIDSNKTEMPQRVEEELANDSIGCETSEGVIEEEVNISNIQNRGSMGKSPNANKTMFTYNTNIEKEEDEGVTEATVEKPKPAAFNKLLNTIKSK